MDGDLNCTASIHCSIHGGVDGTGLQRLQPSTLSSLPLLLLPLLALLSSLLLAKFAGPLTDPASLLEAQRPPKKASTSVIINQRERERVQGKEG